MPFTSGFVGAAGLKVVDDGFDVELRLPWMRSLPWRCIDQISVALDGQELPGSCLRICVDGRLVGAGECSTWDGYWVVGRAITAQVRRRGRVQDGTLLRVSIRFFIPYIGGDGGPAELLAATTMQLPVERVEAASV